MRWLEPPAARHALVCPPCRTRREREPGPGGYGLYEKRAVTSPRLPLPITICSDIVPSVGCQASSVYVPTGRSMISNLPSASVTAAYGESLTTTYACILGWMPHLSSMTSSALALAGSIVRSADLGACCLLIRSLPAS